MGVSMKKKTVAKTVRFFDRLERFDEFFDIGSNSF